MTGRRIAAVPRHGRASWRGEIVRGASCVSHYGMPSANARPCLVSALLTAVLGCDPGEAAGTEGCDAASTGGQAQEAVAIAVDCSFVFGDAQIDVTYEVSGDAPDVALGGKLIASGHLSDSEYEGRSFSMTIFAEDGTVQSSALYQLDRTRLPVNEFQGDHGFTGLNSVKDPDAQEGVQFACFARDPAMPVHAWEN